MTDISTECEPDKDVVLHQDVLYNVLYDREFYGRILTHDVIDSLKDLWNQLGRTDIFFFYISILAKYNY